MNLNFPGANGTVRIIGSSAVAVTNGATVTEDTFVTTNLAAGAMGTNGLLRVKTWWTVTNSVNNKTMRVRFSGGAGTIAASYVVTTAPSLVMVTEIQNANATGAQMMANFGLSSAGIGINNPQRPSIDTSVATSVVITGQKALAGETITLESYIVELILP